MIKPNTVKSLTRKYGELLGQLQRNPEASAIKNDLAHVEAVARMFDPSWDASTVAPVRPQPPCHWGKRGIRARMAIDILRAAQRPMTVREIATAMMEARGLPADDGPELLRVMIGTRYALTRRLGYGIKRDGNWPARWSLIASR